MQGMEIVSCGAVGIIVVPVHVASRHHAEMLQFLRSNPHTIHDCPIVAFAFLVYKFACRLII